MKCRDPKTNLEPGENLIKAWDVIDFMMMIPMNPYLARQLSLFMTINLYMGAHESESRGQHRGT
jgi:hypothetical protein